MAVRRFDLGLKFEVTEGVFFDPVLIRKGDIIGNEVVYAVKRNEVVSIFQGRRNIVRRTYDICEGRVDFSLVWGQKYIDKRDKRAKPYLELLGEEN